MAATNTECLDLAKLTELGIDTVQLETVDLDGVLRGKFLPAQKVKPDARVGFCTIVYQLTPADDVWVTRHSSFDNGFPDVIAIPDAQTAIRWPWRRDTAAVIFDMIGQDGAPYPLAPRSVLKKMAARFEETGLEPKFGIELEVFVMHADDELIAQGRHHEMKPLGRTHNAYRLTEVEETRDLGAEFMRRMRDIDITVEAFHAELGFGAIEFALSPAGPVQAADNATRAKTYFRQLCAERKLAATFMAKWKVGESGSGGHMHQSLWRNGENAFYGSRDGELSKAALLYGAGLIETMPDFAVFFRPNINSYRRFDHTAWSPENASWGYDNRSAALRAVAYPSRNAYRFEHRVPGADTNIYLSLAAMLAGGHHGLVRGVAPPEPASANAALEARFVGLASTLPEATARLRNSAIAKEYFGEVFVEHYAASRDIEWARWQAWQAEQVTSYELKRYFQTI